MTLMAVVIVLYAFLANILSWLITGIRKSRGVADTFDYICSCMVTILSIIGVVLTIIYL